jgi:hypothetical protein
LTRKWTAIVARGSTWWGWDHWSYKAAVSVAAR